MDSGLQTDAFILDFAKAFDSVPHQHLKAKLHGYGISGKTLIWLDSLLCYRSQRVIVNGTKSKWLNVTSGVPQGTVLGPMLFNLFINDIVDGIKSEIRLFADDCMCYWIIHSHDDCDQLQRDISTLGSWARQWSSLSISISNKKSSKLKLSLCNKTSLHFTFIKLMQHCLIITIIFASCSCWPEIYTIGL